MFACCVYDKCRSLRLPQVPNLRLKPTAPPRQKSEDTGIFYHSWVTFRVTKGHLSRLNHSFQQQPTEAVIGE